MNKIDPNSQKIHNVTLWQITNRRWNMPSLPLVYLFHFAIRPCLEMESVFFTTRKKSTNSQQQQSFLWLINSARPQSVEFRSFRSIKAEVCSSLCWLVGHKESFLCVQRQNASSVCHLQLRKKNQLTALNNAHWLKLGLTCLTQPGKHTHKTV